MNRLPVGSLVWLYEPPALPIEGMIIGYEDGAVRLAINRRQIPLPLVAASQVYAQQEWRWLVETLRADAARLEQAAAAIEAECTYRCREEEEA